MPVTEKVLNSNLGRKKKAAERLGWKFTPATPNTDWSAEKKFKGKDIEVIRNIKKLADVLDRINSIEVANKALYKPTKVVTNEFTKVNENVNEFATDYPEFPLEMIRLSKTPLQEIRRRRFTETNLNELVESVRQKGVLEPVLLRRVFDKFELVAGERRFLAANRAGLLAIPGIVKELSDDEVEDIQIHENLHRETPHAMDESYNYAYMLDDKGYSIQEIALRVGKTERHVAERLKLKLLPENIQDAFAEDKLTLSHALEIAKYPTADMQEIYSYCFNNFQYESESLFPLPKVKQRIEQHYLLRLKKAPFSIKSKDLRSDGMACVNCPERTGANALLFEEEVGDRDSCLNRKCYTSKIERHIQIQREKIVVETKNVPEEKAVAQVKKVPLLSTSYHINSSDRDKLPEPVLIAHDYKIIKNLDECTKAEYGVFAHGDRNGQKVVICRKSKNCPKHWKEQFSTLPKAEKPVEIQEAESLERRNRKEEIIDVNVGEVVRRQVLKKAALKFDTEHTIFNHEKAEDYLYALTARLWHYQCNWNSEMADIIRTALGVSQSRLPHAYSSDWMKSIKDLSMDERSRLFFLIIHADMGWMHEGGYFESQNGIKELADEFDVDYRQIDAFERLKYAQDKHEKHAKEFHNYLVKVENGEADAQIPRVYSPDYKPKE